jgi:hypothetical protein
MVCWRPGLPTDCGHSLGGFDHGSGDLLPKLSQDEIAGPDDLGIGDGLRHDSPRNDDG